MSVYLFVCMRTMAGRTAGLIKTKLGIGTDVDPGSVLVKVKVKVIYVCVRCNRIHDRIQDRKFTLAPSGEQQWTMHVIAAAVAQLLPPGDYYWKSRDAQATTEFKHEAQYSWQRRVSAERIWARSAINLRPPGGYLQLVFDKGAVICSTLPTVWYSCCSRPCLTWLFYSHVTDYVQYSQTLKKCLCIVKQFFSRAV